LERGVEGEIEPKMAKHGLSKEKITPFGFSLLTGILVKF